VICTHDILPCSASYEVDNTDEEHTVHQYYFNQPSVAVLLWHSLCFGIESPLESSAFPLSQKGHCRTSAAPYLQGMGDSRTKDYSFRVRELWLKFWLEMFHLIVKLLEIW